jgi:GNAT superfamily N-acetyltransferase
VPDAAVETKIEVLPATVDRWEDVMSVLEVTGEHGCLCQPWRGKDDVEKAERLDRSQRLRRQMTSSSPAPGFVAYLHGDAVGWVGVAVRTQAPRLMHSRTIPLVDERAVWSIGCFRIRTGFRRQGVARALLAGVVDAARSAGAPGVEAYPIDPEGKRVDVGAGYVGIASMFDAAGFRRVLTTDATSGRLPRILVRLDLP